MEMKLNNISSEKQFEYIQKEIQNISSGLEMAGFLHGIEDTALYWCMANAPEYVSINEKNETELAIYGLAKFLESEFKREK